MGHPLGRFASNDEHAQDEYLRLTSLPARWECLTRSVASGGGSSADHLTSPPTPDELLLLGQRFGPIAGVLTS